MPIPFSAVGTIATAPKLKTAENRAAFCTFRVACNDRRFDREQGRWVDGDTNWLTINAFRGLALHAEESFRVGDRVIVHGRLRVRQWESSDKSGVSVEVDADALGHDLRWGVSTFTKRHSSSAPDESHQSNAADTHDSDGPVSAVDPLGTHANTGTTEPGGGGQGAWLSETDAVEASPEATSDGFTPGVAA